MTFDIPKSIEAEQATLGALLTDPGKFASVHAFLKPDDFWSINHRAIYAAMESLFMASQPIDPVTLSEKLQATGQLSEVGGPAYLTQLIRYTPTSQHVEVYARLVQKLCIRRQLMVASDEIKALAIDETIPLEEVNAEVERSVLSVTGLLKPVSNESWSESVFAYLDGLEYRMERIRDGKSVFVPTGMPTFDIEFGGSYPGELLIIGAPSKMGKSTFTLSIARSRLKMGLNMAIFSTEMTKAEIIQKWLAMETEINAMKLKGGDLSGDEYQKVLTASTHIQSWKVHIFDEYYPLTPLDILRTLRQLKRSQGGVDVVLIDGLWMMKYHSQVSPRYYEVARIMSDLAQLAKKHKVPIDIVHQMSKAPDNRKDKRPLISDYAESSAVQRWGHTLMGLYREDFYNHDIVGGIGRTEAFIMANRNGNTRGCIKIAFDKKRELYGEVGEFTSRDEPPVFPPPPPGRYNPQ